MTVCASREPTHHACVITLLRYHVGIGISACQCSYPLRARSPDVETSMSLFETLEPRVLLATVTWDGGAGTNFWHDAMNWDGDVLPGPSDDVLINVAGDALIEFTMGAATVRSINNWERFELSGGTIFATNGWSQRGVMTMTGGVVDGNGDLFIRGGLEWSGGAMRVHRAITETGVDVTISGTVFLESLFNSYGDMDWTGGNIKFNGGLLINNSGLFKISSDGVALNDGGVNEIGNKAAMTRQNGGVDVTQTIIDVPFKSGGTVTLTSGHLRINNTAKLYDDVTVADGTVLRFFSPHSHFGKDVGLSGDGELTFAGGADHELYTSLHVAELNVINGANVAVFKGTGSAERVALNGTLHVFNGTMAVSDRIRALGGFGSGLTINEGALLSIDAESSFDTNFVRNYGTVALKRGVWKFSIIINHAVIDLLSGAIEARGLGLTIVNLAGGVITKRQPGTMEIGPDDDVTFTNDGLLRVNAGSLEVGPGDDDFVSEGTIQVDDGAILKLMSGSFEFRGNVEGQGAIRMHAGVTMRWHTPNADIDHLIIDQGSIIWFDDDIADAATIKRVTLSGTLFFPTDTLTVTGRLDVYAGKISSSGDLHVASGAFFVIHGDVDHLADMTNDGTVILKNNAEWRLHKIDLVNNGDMFIQSGVIEEQNWHSSMLNTGVITKHTPGDAQITGDTEVDRILLTNSGEIRVNEGELVIHGGGESSGIIKAGALGAIEFTSRPFTITGGSIVGDGAVRFNVASGSIWFAGSISVSTLHVDTNLTLKSAGEKTLDVDVLNVNAGLIWRSGDLTFRAHTATIDGTLHFEAIDTFTPTGTTALTIGADGRLLQQGASTVDFGAATTLHNLGMVEVSGGELRFRPGAVQNLDDDQTLTGGTWAVLTTGVLKLGEAVRTNAADIRLHGAGSSFVNLAQLTENQGELVIDDQHALHLQSDFTNTGTIDFDAGGTLHVDGDYDSDAGATTSFDVSDIDAGIIFAIGQAQLGGLFQGRWDEPMKDPPPYIDLVSAASVVDDASTADFIEPPVGYDVTLDFELPNLARIKFAPS